MEESGRHVAIFTAMTNDVLENACKQLLLASTHFLLSAPTHFCSGLVHIFALGSYTILLLARTQFCSWLVRNFALGSYAILLLARTQFCSPTTARTNFCSPTVARTRDLPGHRTIHHTYESALWVYTIALYGLLDKCCWNCKPQMLRSYVQQGGFHCSVQNHRSLAVARGIRVLGPS